MKCAQTILKKDINIQVEYINFTMREEKKIIIRMIYLAFI